MAFEALLFDSDCARAYGRVCAEVVAHQLPLYTLNASDLRGLEDLVEIVDLG